MTRRPAITWTTSLRTRSAVYRSAGQGRETRSRAADGCSGVTRSSRAAGAGSHPLYRPSRATARGRGRPVSTDQGRATGLAFFGSLDDRANAVLDQFGDDELALIDRFITAMAESVHDHVAELDRDARPG